jgi:hypothetical protein
MDPEERATGTRNEEYNLVSVLYHALHGAEACKMHALDAEAAGDDELASFFRNVQGTHRQVDEQAKTRLYTGGGVARAGTAEVPPEDSTGPGARPSTDSLVHGAIGTVEPRSEVPPKGPLPPGCLRTPQ